MTKFSIKKAPSVLSRITEGAICLCKISEEGFQLIRRLQVAFKEVHYAVHQVKAGIAT